MSGEKFFGINPLVSERALGKRVIELMSGKGGLLSLLWWFDNLDYVEDIADLTDEISRKFTFVDTALTACAKESIARPEFIREKEFGPMLGYTCVNAKCGKGVSAMAHRNQKYCSCGQQLKLTYLIAHKKLRSLNIVPTPEAVFMSVAYDQLSDAYVQGNLCFKRVLSTFVKEYGWSSALQFVDSELKDKLDAIFYYYESGDIRYSKEERELLMLIARANLADIPLAEVNAVIRAGIEVCKYGYLFNKLRCSGAVEEYIVKRAEFSPLYNAINAQIRKKTVVTRKEREKRTVEYLKIRDKDGVALVEYFAWYLLPEQFWSSGRLSKNIVLQPIVDPPIYTTYKDCAVNLCVALSGKGKSTLMANHVCTAFEREHELIFNVLGDESNSLCLAFMPLFPCGGRTGALLKSLALTGIQPHGIPTLNLTFLRSKESIRDDNYEANPPTKYDRIIKINEPWRFGFKFVNGEKTVKNSLGVINILEKEIYPLLSYKRADWSGLINVRNLCRYSENNNEDTNADIEIATWLLDKFAAWRENCKKPAARIIADEASYLAPSTFAVAGKDTSRSSGMLTNTIKKVRKKNTSFDLGTQKYSEIAGEVKVQAFNVWFRELPQTGDKGRSQRDLVLDSLALKGGKAEREVIAGMMEKGIFPDDEFYWFWWNMLEKRIRVVKPTVPFFMINQPQLTNRQVIQKYEKFSGQKVLLDSWEQVDSLEYEDETFFKKEFRPA